MGTTKVRACNTCIDPGPGKCKYVIDFDAEKVGKCHFDDLQPPYACLACSLRNHPPVGAGAGAGSMNVGVPGNPPGTCYMNVDGACRNYSWANFKP